MISHINDNFSIGDGGYRHTAATLVEKGETPEKFLRNNIDNNNIYYEANSKYTETNETFQTPPSCHPQLPQSNSTNMYAIYNWQ